MLIIVYNTQEMKVPALYVDYTCTILNKQNTQILKYLICSDQSFANYTILGIEKTTRFNGESVLVARPNYNKIRRVDLIAERSSYRVVVI